jgi:hypothetical protein
VTDEQATDRQEPPESGGDSPEGKAEQDQERDRGAAAGGDGEGASGSGHESDEVAKARRASEEEEKAKEKLKELEENPPEKLEDWPDDKAKYETFGGAEGEESYEESVTGKLGPSSLRYREDGGVEIEGEAVDDPDQYKGDPIPGGPTDPSIGDSRAYGEPDMTDETSVEVESKGNGDSDEGDSDGDGESSEESQPAGSHDKSDG